MRKIILSASLLLIGCGFETRQMEELKPEIPVIVVPVASAKIDVLTYGDLAKRSLIESLLIPKVYAQVSQGSATISVTYNNPSVSTFAVNTSSFGNAITATGNELNLGSITVAGLDDNTLRVCTGVGAPGNKCNRLYIRVFTLGTTPGFINQDEGYGLDLLVNGLGPIGTGAAANSASVTNPANVYTYNIPNGRNRIVLTQLSIPAINVKADLSNAGNGMYSMSLVVQYALGYVP